MLAITFVLASSIAWGTADFLAGIASRKSSAHAVLFIQIVLGLALMAIFLGFRGEAVPAGAETWVPLAIASGLASGVGLAALYRGFERGRLSVVGPISATGGAVPPLVGSLTGEPFGPIQMAGAALAVLGVVMAASEGTGGERDDGRNTGAAYGVVAALGFGLFFLCMGEAAEREAYWSVLVNRATEALLIGGAAAAMHTRLPTSPRVIAPIAVIAALDIGAHLLYAIASAHDIGPLGAVIASLYPATTVLLAYIVLGERLRSVQRIGVISALAGVAALSVGALPADQGPRVDAIAGSPAPPFVADSAPDAPFGTPRSDHEAPRSESSPPTTATRSEFVQLASSDVTTPGQYVDERDERPVRTATQVRRGDQSALGAGERPSLPIVPEPSAATPPAATPDQEPPARDDSVPDTSPAPDEPQRPADPQPPSDSGTPPGPAEPRPPLEGEDDTPQPAEPRPPLEGGDDTPQPAEPRPPLQGGDDTPRPSEPSQPFDSSGAGASRAR